MLGDSEKLSKKQVLNDGQLQRLKDRKVKPWERPQPELTPEEEAAGRSLQAKWDRETPMRFPGPALSGNGAARASRDRVDHAHGLVLGAAIGDALAAPFRSEPPGAFTERFPVGSPELEMVGGGGWSGGEFTGNTQLAVLEALGIIEAGWIDTALIFAKFQTWAASDPVDIGVATRTVLTDPVGWPGAPRAYSAANRDSAAGNGGLTRAGLTAARWAISNNTGTAVIARLLSSVTHTDRAAAEGRSLFHMFVSEALRFKNPFDSLDWMLKFTKDDQTERYTELLGPNPPSIPGNKTVWGCLRDAVQAVRNSNSFEECLRRAADLGSDVATVAGGLAGAICGVDEIPQRWVDNVHGQVLGTTYDAADLVEVCDRLMGLQLPNMTFDGPDRGSWLPDR